MLGDNVAEVALVADYSRLATGLRSAGKLIGDFAAGANAHVANLGLKAPKKGMGILAHAGGQVAGNLMMRGIDLIVDQGKKVFDFEESLTRLGIAARMTAPKLDDIRKAARETSVATGVDADVVLDSYRAYIDLAGAQEGSIAKMKLLASVGQATGAEGKDLAGMMYQLVRSMKITDDQMEDTMGGLINQAKDGAVEAKQMAAEFSSMMPIFARFGVTGREGALQLGAMFQVTRDGFDSASQAATGMVRLMAGLQRHASRFAEHGVQVFKPGSKSELREMSDIMQQIKKSDLSKNTEALVKAFGRSEAWRTFKLLEEAPDRLRQLEQAGRANGVIQQDLATLTESSAGRMRVAFAKLSDSVAQALTPDRVAIFATALGGLLGILGDALGGVSKLATALRQLGVGKTFEEQVDRTRAKRLEERLGFHERQLEQEYYDKGMAPFDPNVHGVIEKQAQFRVGQEDALRERIAKDQGMRANANVPAAYRQGRFGPELITPEMNKGAYSVEELQAIKRMPGVTGASDAAMMKIVIDDAIARRKEQDAAFVKALVDAIPGMGKAVADAMKPTTVAIDGNPVAKAGDNATDRRRK